MEWAGQVLASAVLDPLLERAISAVSNEIKLIRGVHKEVEKLALTLAVIQRLLDDAEERQVREPAIRDWLRQLKQVFLDADDLLDEYATDAARKQQVSTGAGQGRKEVRTMMFSCFTCISNSMTGRATAHQICEINKRLDHLASVKNQFGLQVSSEGRGINSRLEHTRRPQTSSILADVTSVIGRETVKHMIIELLLSSTDELESSSSSNRSFSILPIVGMGGMGKTTMAQLVFNDDKVKRHFQLMMWICVSNDFDPTRLTKEMIDAASASKLIDAASASKLGKREHYQITHWDLMQKKLGEEVEGRTFLLVLDDVWGGSRSQWENLFEPLKFANKGSKILVTSRNSNALGISRGRMSPITLQGLPEDDLWQLFKRCAFGGSSEEEYAHLEEIGRQIAKRLKGLPLAAKTIGYLLNTKLDVSHWRKVWRSETWELQQDEEDGVLPALGLSYQYLPANLKQCFAYCSLFPKDHNFDKTEMAQLWDAECFSGVTGCRGMRDISGEYFDGLLHRSFFEPSPNWEGGYVMHDLTHDLAEYVSKDDCFRLEGRSSDAKMAGTTIRHMSVLVTEFDRAKLNEACRHERLRTLVFLSRCKFDDPTHALDVLFLKLKWLRVLRLLGCWIKELPSSIGDLKHLRYIDLSDNPLEKLPESLGNVYNLQVLKLGFCDHLRLLPTRMSELINLRHLQAENELFFGIHGLARLTGLEEVAVRGRKLREVGAMNRLRELRISSLEEVRTQGEAIQGGLDSKEHLRELMIGWGNCNIGLTSAFYGMRDANSINPEVEEEVLRALRPVDTIRELKIAGYGGARSPSWMADPTTWARFCLERVELCYCPNWEVLPALGRLRRLKYLKINNMPSVRQLYLHLFPSLEELLIDDLPEWEEWRRGGPPTTTTRRGPPPPPPPPQQNPSSPGHLFFFPRLQQLAIWNCPKLSKLPPLPPALKVLHLDGVPGLTSLPGLQYLSSLSKLTLCRCPTMAASLFVSLATHHRHHHPLAGSLTYLHIEECGYYHHHQQSLTTIFPRVPPAVHASFFSALPYPAAPEIGPRVQRDPPDESADPLRRLAPRRLRMQRNCDIGDTHSPEDAAAAGGLRALTSLRQLTIRRSPNLLREWGGDGLPSSLHELNIVGDDDLNDEFLSRHPPCLTALEVLSISHCPVITSLPAALLHSQMMTTLRGLKIEDCEELASLGHFAALPSLKRLTIKNCPKLHRLQMSSSSCCSSSTLSSRLEVFTISNSSPQQMKGWLLESNLALPFLQELRITSCPQLTSFDEEGGGKELEEALLHLAPSLRSLSIDSCGNLRSLPAALNLLTSLQTLELTCCPLVQSLPDMGLPPSLRELRAWRCPALEKRCRDRSSPEWPNISHIPEVYVDHRRVI